MQSSLLQPFEFSTTPRVAFGSGAVAKIASARLVEPGMEVAIVTDPGIKRLELHKSTVDVLERLGATVHVFDAVSADPPVAIVREAAEFAATRGSRLVVGIGGGSSLDVAKLVAVLARGNDDLDEMYGIGNVKGPRLPLILVPTTAGTGSEVTPIAIVTTASDEKNGIISPVLFPDLAVLDPELTVGLPPAVTAATGIDAMVHAIESYTSGNVNNNPLSKTLAVEALSLLAGAVRTAVVDGSDVDARGRMLLGSMLAGQAFANAPVAAVHALAYPLGGRFHLPHGLSNALVLPHVMKRNLVACNFSYAQLATVAFPDLAQALLEHRAALFIERLQVLIAELGLPTRLRDLGIGADNLADLATDAMKQTRLLVNNPVPFTHEMALDVYRDAW